MEMEALQTELKALLSLYSLQRWIGDQPESSASGPPLLDERASILLKELLDRRWDAAVRSYSQTCSQVVTPPPPVNQPPQPQPVLKRQCSHCQERTLQRQQSIVMQRQQSIGMQRQQSIVNTRAVAGAAAAARYEGSGSWTSRSRTSYTASCSSYTATDSAATRSRRSCSSRSTSCSSYSSVEKLPPIRRRMGRAGRGRARGRSRSISSYSSSTYSVARAGPSCWGGARARGGHKIVSTLGRIVTDKAKKVFNPHVHHHAGSMWRQAKEILLPVLPHRRNKPRRSSKRPDEVDDRKGKKTVPAKKKNLGRTNNKPKINLGQTNKPNTLPRRNRRNP